MPEGIVTYSSLGSEYGPKKKKKKFPKGGMIDSVPKSVPETPRRREKERKFLKVTARTEGTSRIKARRKYQDRFSSSFFSIFSVK